MKKLSRRWVPWLFTLDHKHAIVKMFKQSLTHFQCKNKIFLHRFVTIEEITKS